VLDVTLVEDYTPAVAKYHAALLTANHRLAARRTRPDHRRHRTSHMSPTAPHGRPRARFDELPDLQARILPEPRAD
jgi:hypothetical protein